MALGAAAPRQRDPSAWALAGAVATTSLVEAEAICRRIARRHYENFTVATRLVPADLRQDFANVYAFARWSDDLADEAPGVGTAPAPPSGTASGGTVPEGDAALAGLAAWRDRLERCRDGRPDHPVFVALADTIRRRDLSLEPFSHLLDAFEEDRRFDLAGVAVRYPTRDAVVGYCRRSADPVGRIVLAIGGCRSPDLVALSDAICTGLQLVNFWQDIRRDRLAGRVYVPAEDMVRLGVDEGMLDAPTASPALRRLVAEEVAWARTFFDRGSPLVDAAPAALRPAIRLFVGGGRAVADAIERAGCDTLARRPVVGAWSKAKLAAAAWWATLVPARRAHPAAGSRGSSPEGDRG